MHNLPSQGTPKAGPSQYWDVSWNPVSGCTPISEGCQNCYAQGIYHRFKRSFNVTLHADRLDLPSKWRKPRRVFVDSASDLFHKDVPYGFIGLAFTEMSMATQHTYYVLTKRADIMLDFMQKFGKAWALPNVWLGVTAENQARADERIPLLLRTPAAHRFVSVEPMLGPVNLASCLEFAGDNCGYDHLDWVICGPETGRKARPYDPQWIADLHAQCKAAGVPFWDKRKVPLAREQP